MKSAFHLRAIRSLFVAAIVFATGALQAATVNTSQQRSVRIGMSQAEVLQILGRPADVFRFRGASGPSWTYFVSGAVYGTTEFDVDFGPDGKVIAAYERALPSGG